MRAGALVVRLSQADVDALALRVGRTRALVTRYRQAVEAIFGRQHAKYARLAERHMERAASRCGLDVPVVELPPVELPKRVRWTAPQTHRLVGAMLVDVLDSIDPPDGRIAVPSGCMVPPESWSGSTIHLDHLSNALNRVVSVRHGDEVMHAELAAQYQGSTLDTIFAVECPRPLYEGAVHMPWTRGPRTPNCVEPPQTVYLMPDPDRDARIYRCTRCSTRVYDRQSRTGGRVTTWEADRHQIQHARYRCEGARYRLQQLAQGLGPDHDVAARLEDQRRAAESLAHLI